MVGFRQLISNGTILQHGYVRFSLETQGTLPVSVTNPNACAATANHARGELAGIAENTFCGIYINSKNTFIIASNTSVAQHFRYIVMGFSSSTLIQWGITGNVKQDTYESYTINIPIAYKSNYIVCLTQWDNGQKLGLTQATGAHAVHTKTLSQIHLASYSWTYKRFYLCVGR